MLSRSQNSEALLPVFKEIDEYLQKYFEPLPCELRSEAKKRCVFLPLREESFAPCGGAPSAAANESAALEDLLIPEPDESFALALLRIIDGRGLTDPEVYNKAQISRQLFNSIKNNPGYHPGKQTVISLLCALELPIGEFKSLLERAGYALSRSSRFDLIIRYCVENGIYNIQDINEILYHYDQPLLGSGQM